MGFFGSKGNECWVCHRKTAPEGQFLTPDELQAVFTDVFDEFKADEMKNYCLCQICAGIFKYTSQDSVKAKIKINEASEVIKEKFEDAKSKLKNKFSKKS